jgi:hypothetical protein
VDSKWWDPPLEFFHNFLVPKLTLIMWFDSVVKFWCCAPDTLKKFANHEKNHREIARATGYQPPTHPLLILFLIVKQRKTDVLEYFPPPKRKWHASNLLTEWRECTPAPEISSIAPGMLEARHRFHDALATAQSVWTRRRVCIWHKKFNMPREKINEALEQGETCRYPKHPCSQRWPTTAKKTDMCRYWIRVRHRLGHIHQREIRRLLLVLVPDTQKVTLKIPTLLRPSRWKRSRPVLPYCHPALYVDLYLR